MRQLLHRTKILLGGHFSNGNISRRIFNADDEYKPEKVFNEDKTVLFWKRMSNKIVISKSEKSALDFKAIEDRVELLLCSNASGDSLINPLMLLQIEKNLEL